MIVKKINAMIAINTIDVKMGLINIKIMKLPKIIIIETNKSSGTWCDISDKSCKCVVKFVNNSPDFLFSKY